MNNVSKENALLKKVLDLGLTNEIKDSELYLNLLNKQLEIYKNQIEFLEDTKPMCFQKKEISEHNKKIKECENKICEIYKKIEEELNLIIKMKKSINNIN